MYRIKQCLKIVGVVSLLSFCSLALARENYDPPHPDFIKSFRKAEKLLREGKMNKADEKIGEIEHYRDNNSMKPSEEAHVYLLTYWQAEKKGNKDRARDQLEKMVEIGARRIDAELFTSSAMSLFKQQVEGKEYAEALHTVELMKDEKRSKKALKDVKSIIKKIEAFVSSDQPLIQPIEVGESKVATRKMIRPTIYLDRVEGKVEKFHLDCEKKQKDIPFSVKAVLTIPASWGTCSVQVHADTGSKFDLVQLKQ